MNTSPRLSYIICTNPRSGSWLLAEGLCLTGVAGYPREAFTLETTGHTEAAHCKLWGIPLPSESNYEQYLSHTISDGTTSNGIFGLKCMNDQFLAMPAKLRTIPGFSGLKTPQIMEKAFPNLRYIRLHRRDKIRQAISYYRAFKTDIWRIENTQNAKPIPTAPEPPFDMAAISHWVKTLKARDDLWQNYFNECGQTPLIVNYEDLETNYEKAIIRILEYLEVKNIRYVKIPAPPYKKLAPPTTDEWVERYMKILESGG